MGINNKALIFLALLLFFGILNGRLIDFYKKGAIKFEACQKFGKDTDWEGLFYDSKKELTVAPDGCIFVLNTGQHNVYKFNKEGRLIDMFGREGRGPGDLHLPGNLTILDNKYLIIGEYATNRRISIFDFSGKCVNVLKTHQDPFNVIALKNNKIAYLNYQYSVEKKKRFKESTTLVVTKDILSGEEKIVDAKKMVKKGVERAKNGTIYNIGNFSGEVFIKRTGDGNLLVGLSNTSDIKIYSPHGKLIRSFQLKISPTAVTADYIEKSKVKMFEAVKENLGKEQADRVIKQLKGISFKSAFGTHLPYYRDIIVDSEGNILFFKWTDCVGECVKVFQVYSPDGKLLCETKIDEGIFDFDIDPHRKNITFTERGIFALLKVRGAEDFLLKLVKINVK